VAAGSPHAALRRLEIRRGIPCATRLARKLPAATDTSFLVCALCAACHGTAGVSINPIWPSLAGQHAQYLAKQIRRFRDGEREEITMQPFVQNLSDQDIEDLAAYYASLNPCP